MLISHTSRVIANFMLNEPNFRYGGNRDKSGANLNDIIKLTDPKTPQFGATIYIGHITYTGRVTANFVFIFSLPR